jgi:flagellar biosynthesis/type III secretory pathway protein FliH
MSGVIRTGSFRSACAFSFEDLESRGQQILRAAAAERARLLQEARLEAQRAAVELVEQSRAEGLAQGRAAGLEQARREAAETALAEARRQLAQLRQALEQALRDFDQAKRELLAEAEAGVISLALAIARRVCKRIGNADTTPAIENTRHALALARNQADLELRLHPDEMDAVRAAVPELLERAAGIEHVRVLADEQVSRGGCVLSMRDGAIDATIEAQLERIADVLAPPRATA